eukprot:gene14536-biopygen11160
MALVSTPRCAHESPVGNQALALGHILCRGPGGNDSGQIPDASRTYMYKIVPSARSLSSVAGQVGNTRLASAPLLRRRDGG